MNRLCLLALSISGLLPVGAEAATPSSTGFEDLKPGPLLTQRDRSGEWSAADGHATVHTQHKRSGKQSLRLLGGEQRQIVWTPAKQEGPLHQLDFWYERWTRRVPYDFRVEVLVNGEWKTLHHDTKKAIVGSFKNHLSLKLGEAAPEKVRFTSTTPASSGVMIDDLRLVKATPMKVVSLTARQPTLPVLVRNEQNPLLEIVIETEGNLKPLICEEILLGLDSSTAFGDIAHVEILGSVAGKLSPFGKPAEAGGLMEFSGKQTLEPGQNRFLVSVQLKENARPTGRINVRCKELKIGSSVINPGVEQRPPEGLRIGYAVRRAGDDGSHTYRIPGLATTNKGSLIGVYDVRRRSGGDLPGDIDVGMSRSTDGGRSWEPMRVIMDMGSDPAWRYDGIGDPAILVDRQTGTIWVAATWSHGNRSWRGSGPGLTPEETGQLMLVRSDDDGLTWSKPINITKQVKKPEWCFLLQGPGKGITMRDGTIVFAAQFQDTPENKRLPRSTILYSKDHGETWQIGTGAFDDTTESQVVEVEPGVLMLNCRYNRQSARVVMITHDMGKTWQEHSTSRRALIEPRACMASLINVDQELGKDVGGWLLFSNPDSLAARERITIKASPDGGKTWPKQHRVLLDEGRGAGYSCLTMIDEKTVGILYEGSRAHMTFQRIPLQDLIGQAGSNKTTQKAKPVEPGLALPQVFGDHMVLQAGLDLPVWGTAKPNHPVAVTFGGETTKTTADRDGKWNVTLPPRQASRDEFTLLVRSGGDEIELTDILIGEVWVCAGQSNMEWPLASSTGAADELANADRPQIRLLNLVGGARGSSGSYNADHLARLTPEKFSVGKWQRANAESARGFSAVAWHFGRGLNEKLGVPIGLICPAVGGTPTEAWIRRAALEEHPQLKGLLQGNWLDNELLGEFCRTRGNQNLLRAIQAGEPIPGDDLGPNHSFKPAFMWQAGIQPLLPFAIRGAIWYQGESNAETAARVQQHAQLFPLLIRDWRAQWRQGDFPFLFVQLPALKRPDWPAFRDSQRRILSDVPNTGMAITIDTGHPSNVHPADKKPVGKRLARWALATAYQRRGSHSYSGPLYDSHQIRGGEMNVSFRHARGGLKSSDGKPLRHFEIAGADGVFHPARATLADSGIVLSNPDVKRPLHARYAWSPFPEPPVNLVNADGLPASPFTTESPDQVFRDEAASSESKPNSKPNPSRPNILLIVSEDNGAELGCYGDPYARTPVLDQLAKDGCRFANAYVTHAVCSVSRASFLTGLYPFQNGQIGLATHRYAMFEKWDNMPSILKGHGYRTGMIGKLHVNPESAFPLDYRAITSSGFSDRPMKKYASAAEKFFRETDRPFFLAVNFPDAHFPLLRQQYGLPEKPLVADDVKPLPFIGVNSPRLRKGVADYYNCLSRLDTGIGMLLDALRETGKADNTLVIYIGDHGAQFSRGKATCYEGGLRIPMIVRWPGRVKPGTVRNELASTIDLLPTVLEAVGLPARENLPGRSLLPLASGQDAPWREYLFAERTAYSAPNFFPQRTIRDARHKLILNLTQDRMNPVPDNYLNQRGSFFLYGTSQAELNTAPKHIAKAYERWRSPPAVELYDLRSDPWEFRNLAANPKLADVKSRLLTELKSFRERHKDPLLDEGKLKKLAEEHDYVATKLKNGRYGAGQNWKYHSYLR